jgi:hypothetical protein
VAQAKGGGRLAALPFSVGSMLLWTAAGLVPLAVFIWTRGAVAGMTASPFDQLGCQIVACHGGEGLVEPGTGASGAGQPVVEVHLGFVDAEPDEGLALGR